MYTFSSVLSARYSQIIRNVEKNILNKTFSFPTAFKTHDMKGTVIKGPPLYFFKVNSLIWKKKIPSHDISVSLGPGGIWPREINILNWVQPVSFFLLSQHFAYLAHAKLQPLKFSDFFIFFFTELFFCSCNFSSFWPPLFRGTIHPLHQFSDFFHFFPVNFFFFFFFCSCNFYSIWPPLFMPFSPH